MWGVSYLPLKGLCHQISNARKWYSFKGLDMDMRRTMFKIVIKPFFNRHFKFLCWGSKRVQIFYLFQTLFEATLNVFNCSICVLSMPFLMAFFSIIALFAFLKLLELLYIGPEYKLRIVPSTSVQDLNRAAPVTFRTKMEQIRTRIWTLLSLGLRN
jgi:hypothetical protein